jgi:hypothetical protein
VTLVIAGANSSGPRALAQYGLATAVMEAANTWVVSGTGLS